VTFSYSPEARVARKLGQIVLRLTPEEADAFRAWAAEHGGLAALVRWLLAERQALAPAPYGAPPRSRQ